MVTERCFDAGVEPISQSSFVNLKGISLNSFFSARSILIFVFHCEQTRPEEEPSSFPSLSSDNPNPPMVEGASCSDRLVVIKRVLRFFSILSKGRQGQNLLKIRVL